jgi:predicted metal-binding protein
MALLICQTCPRYLHDIRSFGPKMLDALNAAEPHPTVRTTRVACIGGCPTPGNVALDSVGKPRVRFSGLTEHDVDALIEAAVAYEASSSGTPGDWTVPETLAGKISAVSPKR